jgi:hypothetical protein
MRFRDNLPHNPSQSIRENVSNDLANSTYKTDRPKIFKIQSPKLLRNLRNKSSIKAFKKLAMSMKVLENPHDISKIGMSIKAFNKLAMSMRVLENPHGSSNKLNGFGNLQSSKLNTVKYYSIS